MVCKSVLDILTDLSATENIAIHDQLYFLKYYNYYWSYLLFYLFIY